MNDVIIILNTQSPLLVFPKGDKTTSEHQSLWQLLSYWKIFSFFHIRLNHCISCLPTNHNVFNVLFYCLSVSKACNIHYSATITTDKRIYVFWKLWKFFLDLNIHWNVDRRWIWKFVRSLSSVSYSIWYFSSLWFNSIHAYGNMYIDQKKPKNLQIKKTNTNTSNFLTTAKLKPSTVEKVEKKIHISLISNKRLN